MRLFVVQLQPGRRSEHAFSSTIFAHLMDYRCPLSRRSRAFHESTAVFDQYNR
jgi:hypothetical protein